jgi:hypothetical protein
MGMPMTTTDTPHIAPPTRGPRAPRDAVQVFEHDPDLIGDLDERTAAHLRQRTVVPRVWLEPGAWAPAATFGAGTPPGCLGLLVVDGLLTKSLRIGGRDCPELLGAGDVLRPWDFEQTEWDEHGRRWRVLTPTTLAILDHRFAAIAGRWPTVFDRLLQRTSVRAQGLAFHMALAGVRRAEPRMLMLLSHLADRWGRVTAEGVVLPLPLTHELLGHLACLRRPTATVALHGLMKAGLLTRRANGMWVLTRQERDAEPTTELLAA